MCAEKRFPIDGGKALGQKPFQGLDTKDLPSAPVAGAPGRSPTSDVRSPSKDRGRVDIVRETAGRGGKTVTVVQGFTGIGQAEKEELAKKIQKACGAGGTVKQGRIEIQGDQRATATRILAAAGFKPVLSGG